MKKITCLIVSCILIVTNAYAQSTSAILVMLKSENNKVTHFEKIGAADKVATVKADVAATMQVMINDFADNFNYAQVYYFVDTNLQMVLAKRFDGVLFDKDRKIYKTSPIQTTDSNFLIVYYGIPTADNDIDKKENNASYQSVKYPGKGLVILDHNFKRMKRSNLHYIFQPEYSIFRANKDPRYNYVSEDFDIEYREHATRFQRRLQ